MLTVSSRSDTHAAASIRGFQSRTARLVVRSTNRPVPRGRLRARRFETSLWCQFGRATASEPMMVSELKDHLDRYREVLATLNVQGDSPARLEDVIGGSEPVTL